MNTQSNIDELTSQLVNVNLNDRLKSFGASLQGPKDHRDETVLKLLEENDRTFHIFYNNRGYHNHTVHHVLTAYALGASVATLKTIYEKNTSYQRPKPPSKITITEENWTQHLGKPE